MNSRPFSPYNGVTKSISATVASGNVAINSTAPNLRILNVGSVVTFVKTGVGSGTTATAADVAILPNEAILISKVTGHDYIAAITASTTATVYITPVAGGIV